MLTENPGQLKSMVSSSTEIFLTKRILRYIEMNGQLHCWNLAFEPIERKRLKNLKSIMGCSNLCVVFDTPCVLKFLQEREKDSSLHTPARLIQAPRAHPNHPDHPDYPGHLDHHPHHTDALTNPTTPTISTPAPWPPWKPPTTPSTITNLITPTPWPPWPPWPSWPSQPPQPPWPT